jgi:hypothetical protein
MGAVEVAVSGDDVAVCAWTEKPATSKPVQAKERAITLLKLLNSALNILFRGYQVLLFVTTIINLPKLLLFGIVISDYTQEPERAFLRPKEAIPIYECMRINEWLLIPYL